MKLNYFAGAAAVLLASMQLIHATPIVGNIGITGEVTYDTSSSATATAVTSWITPYVTRDTGDFAAPSPFAVAMGTPVVFAPGTWNFNTVAPINNFWAVGGFTFQLLSSVLLQQGGIPGITGYVVVSGTGIVSGNGYSPTVMSWMFTAQDPQASASPNGWTFSASAAPVGVPDDASTIGLLVLALCAVAWMARKHLPALAK